MGKSAPKKVDVLTPQQKQALQQQLGGFQQAFPEALNALMAQLDPERTAQLFQQGVGAPAMRQFEQQTIPAILEASEALGAKGGSAITGQIAQAGENLQQSLQEQLAQLVLGQQQQGIQNILGLGGQSIGQPAFALQQRSLSPALQAALQAGGAGLSFLGGL